MYPIQRVKDIVTHIHSCRQTDGDTHTLNVTLETLKYINRNEKFKNIIWHIDTNRKVLGDEETLNHVLQSLTNILSYPN